MPHLRNDPSLSPYRIRRQLGATATVILLVITVHCAHAQTLWDPSSGVITRMWDTSPVELTMPGHGTDHALTLWSDTRNQSIDLYGQLLDASGAMLWEDEGRSVVISPGRVERFEAVTVGDGWVLAWKDDRGADEPDDGWGVFVQKLTPDGQPLWGNGSDPLLAGLRVHLPGAEARDFRLTLDGAGNPWLVLGTDDNDGGSGLTVRVVRLGNDGHPAPGWPASGVVVGSQSNNQQWEEPLSVLPGGDESIWLRWHESYQAEWLTRVEGDGQFSGVVAQPMDEWCVDGAGGFFGTHEIFEWGEYYEESRVMTRVFRYGPDGGMWTRNLSGLVPKGSYDAVLAPSEPGSVIVVWDAGGYGNYYSYPRYQHVARLSGDDDDVVVWQVNTELDGDPGTNPYPPVADGNGGAIIPFSYSRYFQHITVDGDLIFPPPLGEELGRYQPTTLSSKVAVRTSSAFEDVHDLRLQHYDPVTQTFTPPDSGYAAGYRVRGRVTSFWQDNGTYGLATGSGAVWMMWLDSRYTGGNESRVFAQRHYRDSGEAVFDPYGIDLYPGLLTGASADEFPRADNGGGWDIDVDGSLLVASCYEWTGNGPDGVPTVMQKVSPGGELLWGESGVELQANDPLRWTQHPRLLADGDGGAYVAVEAEYSNYEELILLGRVDAAGEPAWIDGDWEWIRRDDLADADLLGMQAFPDHDGFAIAVRMNDSLLVSAVDGTGGTLWTHTLGPLLNDTVTMQPIGDDMLLVWENDLHGWGQRLSSDGTCLWGDEPLSLAEFDDDPYYVRASVVPEQDSFWFVGRTGPSGDIVQRFGGTGAPMSDLLSVDGAFWPVAMPDGSLYVLAYWDYPYPEDDPLVLVHVPADGQWEPGSQPTVFVGAGGWERSSYGMVPDGQGGVIAHWREEYLSAGHNSFVLQRFNFSATGINGTPTSGLPGTWSLAPVYPNPFNGTATVTLTLPAPAPVELALVNVLGQRVLTVAQGRYPAGPHRFALDGSGLASGVYLLNATTPGHSPLTRKLVVVK